MSIWLKRYPLVSFFILAYGLAWIPMVYGAVTGRSLLAGISFFAPAIAAIIMTIVNDGEIGLRVLISRLFLWRAGIKWYLVALLAPVALELLAQLTHSLLGEGVSSVHFIDWLRMLPAQLPGLALLFVFLILTSAGEELGWRGYALPGLHARFGPVWASLVLGFLWGLWHLPAFYVPGSAQYGLPVPAYVLASIGYTFIYMSIHNGSKGSLLLVCIYHGASNLVLTYGNVFFPKVISNIYLSLPALALLVIIVILISGPGIFSGKRVLAGRETVK